MSKTLRYASAIVIVSAAASGWSTGCSSSGNETPPSGNDAGHSPDGSQSAGDAGDSGRPSGDAGDAEAGVTYVLIDDMETTTHGPIELAGIVPPETPAYWFNFGATKLPEAGPPPDTADPPIMSFTFTALPAPTTTLNGKTSAHAAHQACVLNAIYDVCGIGMEFAQITAPDAGIVDASSLDAGLDGDAGPPIPKITVPFDISRYKGITFWGRTATPVAGDAGGFDVKVLFPDTETDPRGGVCNGANAGASGPTDTSQCYNSYAAHVSFTGDWQQFTVMFTDLAVDPTFGYVTMVPFSGTDVYGINWQAQDNDLDDAAAQPQDVWVDDVFFIQ